MFMTAKRGTVNYTSHLTLSNEETLSLCLVLLLEPTGSN